METNDVIKYFVRNTLGCGCSDDVLSSIDVEPSHLPDKMDIPIHRINVGDRLLIYIVKVENIDVALDVPRLLESGKGERDNLGFNRFRLVLAGNDKDGEALRSFNSFPGGDDRVHVHCISEKEVPRIDN
jgi:hypothetical protein